MSQSLNHLISKRNIFKQKVDKVPNNAQNKISVLTSYILNIETTKML